MKYFTLLALAILAFAVAIVHGKPNRQKGSELAQGGAPGPNTAVAQSLQTEEQEEEEPVELQSRQYWARFKQKARNYRDRIRNRFSRRRRQQQPMYDDYDQQGSQGGQGQGQDYDGQY